MNLLEIPDRSDGVRVCDTRFGWLKWFSAIFLAHISFMFLSRPNSVEDVVLFANKNFELNQHCHHISSSILFVFSSISM